MANINTKTEQQIAMDNNAYTRQALDARLTGIATSDEIDKATSGSYRRKALNDISKKNEREMKRFMGKNEVDPYDNTPGGAKVPRDKIMSLTTSSYNSTLLEKILKASDSSQFQNTTLKFQEQALSYMQTMSADIKVIADNYRNAGKGEEAEENNGLEMQMSNMAKALAELNVEGIAKELGKSVYSKLDSSGYGELVKTMYQSMRDTIQGGEFGAMVKGMIQNTMLKQLPLEMQQAITEFRNDPVKLAQLQLNKLATSDNRAIRDIFGSMYRGMKPDISAKEKKIDMSAKAVFDNKFYTSVTKVIPEQLYKIVAALEGKEQMIFDWDGKQDYISESEEVARRVKARGGTSPEDIQRRAMSALDYVFEQAATSQGVNANSIFKLDSNGSIKRDTNSKQIQFRSSRIKEILMKMTTSELMPEQFATASPAVILSYIGIDKNKKDIGLYYKDIIDIQLMLKAGGFEDRNEALEDLTTLKENLDNSNKVIKQGMINRDTEQIKTRIMQSSAMSADTKDMLLNMFNRQGMHAWGGGGSGNNSGAGSPGRPSTGDSYVRQNSISNSMDMNTDYNAIMQLLTNLENNPEQLSDRDIDKSRDYLDNVLGGRFTKNEQDKIIPKNRLVEFRAKVDSMYQYNAISKENYNRLMNVQDVDSMDEASKKAFDNGNAKLLKASELYKTLTDAGYTAPAQMAKQGITLTIAKRRGYISSPTDLMKVIKDDGSIDTAQLAKFNLTYLDPESDEWRYLSKQANENTRGIIGRGTITKQISTTLSTIFGDPKIANKAGIAVGSAAGLGVAKILKDQGIVTNPKFGWLLGAVGGSLMTMQRTRRFVNDVFGPDGDVKGANGYSNKEIFMAKAMSQYLPAIGVGGKAATMIMKAMSSFGPFGQAMGLITGPILGYGIGLATASIAPKFGKWLFKERDQDSKLGKFANLLKEVPFVKRFFNLPDTRNDNEVRVDAVRRLQQHFLAKAADFRSKGMNDKATKYKSLAAELEGHAKEMERMVQIIRKEEKKDDENFNQGTVDQCNSSIAEHWKAINDIIDKTEDGQDKNDFNRFLNEEEGTREERNRRSGAAYQEYNRTNQENLDKIQSKIQDYWDAEDADRDAMRRMLSGEDDMPSLNIADADLRKRFEVITLKQSQGKDVSGEYKAWLKELKKKDPESYETLKENLEHGSKMIQIKEDLLDEIKKDLKAEGFSGSTVELDEMANRRLQMAIANKGFGKSVLGIAGNTGADWLSRLTGKLSGTALDDTERGLLRSQMDIFNSYGIDLKDHNKGDESRVNRTELQQYRVDAYKEMLKNYNGDRSAEAIKRYWMDTYGKDIQGFEQLTNKEIRRIQGNGGRGTDPIKMSQLSKKHFKTGESLSIAGCSVAAITNALIYMGIEAPEPDTLIGIANNFLTSNGGITSDFFIAVADSLGLKSQIFNSNDNNFTVDTFKYFKPGKNEGLIALLRNQFNNGYHYVTIKTVKGRTLIIDDPEQRGLKEVTAAEIISRTEELISIKASTNTNEVPTAEAAVSSKSVNSNGGNIIERLKGGVTNLIKNAVNPSNMLMSTIPMGSATSDGSGGILSSIIDTLKNTVFNVRVIDDLTLPLKMGDREAALAISKMQMNQDIPSGVKSYARFIRRSLGNKDIQNEFEEQDLMQETIINGGLTAGKSTGAGGKGSGAAVAEGEQTEDGGKRKGLIGSVLDFLGFGDDKNPDGKPKSIGDKVKSGAASLLMKGAALAGNLAVALPALTGMKIFGTVKDMAGNRAGAAARNIFHNYGEEDQQQFDENGNEIKAGSFRDWSGSIRNLRDAKNVVKAGVLAQGGIATGYKFISNTLSKKTPQAIKTIGNAMVGSTGPLAMITKVLNKVFVELPGWLTAHILKSGKIADIIGGAGVVKEGLEACIGFITKACTKLKDKLGKKLAEKGAALLGKSAGGKFLKKIFGKLPGGLLVTAAIQLPFAAYDGFFHAGEIVHKDINTMSFMDRFKVMLAKIFYDIGPDILVGLATASCPPLSILGDICVSLWRMVFTFEELLKLAGLINDDNVQNELNKAEKEGADAVTDLVEGSEKGKGGTTNTGGGGSTGGGGVTASYKPGGYYNNATSNGGSNSYYNGANVAAAGGAGYYNSNQGSVNNLTLSGNASNKYAGNIASIQDSRFTAAHEGFVGHVYRDSEGYRTIGYGFNIDSGRFSKEQVDRWTRNGISQEEAMQVLQEELGKTRSKLEKYDWFNKLDPVRQGAILDMSYNMGVGWIDKFPKAMNALKSGDFETAANEILNSTYAKQVKGRAYEIAELIKYGDGGNANMKLNANGVLEPTPLTNGWASPVKGEPYVTSAFGPRNVKKGSSNHKGVDIRAGKGDPILAAKDGVVIDVSPAHNAIGIEHADGTISRYLHNSTVMVKKGDQVKQGQQIATAGKVGASGRPVPEWGEHLHFEIMKNGQRIDPFIELGLTKDQLKLSPESQSRENIGYLQRNTWLLDQAKSKADEKLLAADATKKSENREAGGPDPGSESTKVYNGNTTIVNRDIQIENFLISLDDKFNKMLELLSKLVNISTESTNNMMSEAIGPARI